MFIKRRVHIFIGSIWPNAQVLRADVSFPIYMGERTLTKTSDASSPVTRLRQIFELSYPESS